MLKEKLQQDLKAAMIARETEKVETLKGLKSAVLYAEVEAGKRDTGLTDDEMLAVFKKESKKRQDAIDLYIKGGNQEMADKEMFEKHLIDSYLPPQLSDEELNKLIDAEILAQGLTDISPQDMGKIIGGIKSKTGSEVDGATLASLVKGRING